MARQTRKHYPLPKRFNAALSEQAYGRLRDLSQRYGLSNNYCLTVLLERLDTLGGNDALDGVYQPFIDEYCRPDQTAAKRR